MNRDTIARVCFERMESSGFDWAPGYAEPGYGYEDPNAPVVMGDWNTHEREEKVLERAGIHTEWIDEWSTCCDCNRAVRTSPDSHSWTPSFVLMNDCEIVCKDCVLEDMESYLDWLREDDGISRRRADTFDVDLYEHGFRRFDHTGESGFHPGQTDTPESLIELYEGTLAHRSGDTYVFQIDDTGQFDISFSLWVKCWEVTT